MTALESMIRRELAQPVPPGAQVLADRLRERYGPALRAVLMYGSNLRQGDDQEGVLDLYALVTSYRSAYRGLAGSQQQPGEKGGLGNLVLAAVNRLLPPNVFYLETPTPRGVVRCKYAVLALQDLPRLTSSQTSEPYFWARFAQPCALVWAADEQARDTVASALVGAVETFVRFGIPFVGVAFDSRELWTTAWQATYGAEIRPERPGAAASLYASNAERFEQATALALPALPWPATSMTEDGRLRFRVEVPARQHRYALARWRLRRLHAKGLFLMRILRNALIFQGGVDYALWKIERHSGVAIDQAWRQKRHPLLALGAEAWRLYRARAFR